MRRRDFLGASALGGVASLIGPGWASAATSVHGSLFVSDGLYVPRLISASLAQSPQVIACVPGGLTAADVLPADASQTFAALAGVEEGASLAALLDDRDAILLAVVADQRGGRLLHERRVALTDNANFIFIAALL